MDEPVPGFLVLFIAIACTVVAAGITAQLMQESWTKDAIAHGYAQYCPTDGKFAWLGECKE